MPVFHTKTIESILEPVAQQVIKISGLVPWYHCRRNYHQIISSRNSSESSEFREMLNVDLINRENFTYVKLNVKRYRDIRKNYTIFRLKEQNMRFYKM